MATATSQDTWQGQRPQTNELHGRQKQHGQRKTLKRLVSQRHGTGDSGPVPWYKVDDGDGMTAGRLAIAESFSRLHYQQTQKDLSIESRRPKKRGGGPWLARSLLEPFMTRPWPRCSYVPRCLRVCCGVFKLSKRAARIDTECAGVPRRLPIDPSTFPFEDDLCVI